MDLNMIFQGKATLEDLMILNELGFEFVIEDGEITSVHNGQL
jgi:hypothetical protein